MRTPLSNSENIVSTFARSPEIGCIDCLRPPILLVSLAAAFQGIILTTIFPPESVLSGIAACMTDDAAEQYFFMTETGQFDQLAPAQHLAAQIRRYEVIVRSMFGGKD